jgi:hypothetical protein
MIPDDDGLSNHEFRHRTEWGARAFNALGKLALYVALLFMALYLYGHHLEPAFRGVK